MDIKKFDYRFQPCIDFNPFIHELEKEKGYNYRDFAGRFNPEITNKILDDISIEFGITRKGWEQSSKGRTKSEQQAFETYRSRVDVIPYLDAWHWMLENCFAELQRGGINYMSMMYLKNKPSWYDNWLANNTPTDAMDWEYWEKYNTGSETPEWVNTILQDIFEACKDHPAFDGEEITFHIDW